MENNLCTRLVETVNRTLLTSSITACKNRIKYEVEYTLNGRLIKEKVCKLHRNSIKKFCERRELLNIKTDYKEVLLNN